MRLLAQSLIYYSVSKGYLFDFSSRTNSFSHEERVMSMEFIRGPLCMLYNLMADGIRWVFNAGPERLMYLSLSRKLVTEKDLFCISLTSGMQAPIFDAVRYLAKIEDRESIPAINQLFEWCVHDCQSDLSESLEMETVSALLELYWHHNAQEFILGNFAPEKIYHLSNRTVRHLLAHAIRTNMNINQDTLEYVYVLVESRRANKEAVHGCVCG